METFPDIESKSYKEIYYFKIDLGILLKEKYASFTVLNIVQKNTEDILWDDNIYHITKDVIMSGLVSDGIYE